MATNNVKIYLNHADKLDHQDRLQHAKYNRVARRIGFADIEQAANAAELAELQGNYVLGNILEQFFDSKTKPYRSGETRTTDTQRVRYLQSYGFSKREARKYLRFAIELS